MRSQQFSIVLYSQVGQQNSKLMSCSKCMLIILDLQAVKAAKVGSWLLLEQCKYWQYNCRAVIATELHSTDVILQALPSVILQALPRYASVLVSTLIASPCSMNKGTCREGSSARFSAPQARSLIEPRWHR